MASGEKPAEQYATGTLDYSSPGNASQFSAWFFLVLSVVPIAGIVLANAVARDGQRILLLRLADSLQDMLPRGVTIAMALFCTVILPILLSFLFAWIARRGLRDGRGRWGKAGRFLAWASCVLYGGMLIAVSLGLIAALLIVKIG